MKIFLILGIFFVLNIGTFAQRWTWKPFSPKNQSWNILAPGELKPDAEALNPESNKGSFSYNDFYGFFAVIYRDSPRRYVPWKPNYSDYIKNVGEGVAQANRGEIIKDVEFSNRRIKGREMEVKFPSGTTRGVEGQVVTKYRVQRFRMFFVGKRFFVVLAVLPENEIDTPIIDKYLNSFVFNTAPKVNADFYSVDEDTTLRVGASSGVLANDTDVEKDILSVSGSKPLTPPSHGSLTINADGSFSYQPEPNYNGRDSFTYKANDGLIDSAAATVTITVNPVNDPPTISGVPASVEVDELTLLKVTATANDIDSPADSLRFSLKGAPAGASIDPKTGVLSWIPSEAQGPGNYTFQVNVSDGEATTGTPISVTVREVNVAPQFSNMPVNSVINELEPYSFAVQAVDTDIPKQNLTYSLVGAPSGAMINPTNGLITWTPTEAQGDGSTYKFAVRVSDGVVTSDAPISLTVKEVNSAPSLSAIPDQNIDELKPFSITLKGTDSDIPANNLTYSLDSGAPAGMTINSKTGVISWTPDEAQGPGDYSVTARVTDDGKPSLSDAKTFKIHVNEVNVAPQFSNVPASATINELEQYSFMAKAVDADIPANVLTFSLIGAPDGAVINPTTGVFTWTPTEAQGPGDYSVTVRVTDNGTPALSDSKTIKIHVNEINVAPKISVIGNKIVDEETPLTFTVKASDADLPANTLSFTMTNAPAGASLDSATGVFNWTPTEAQGAGIYTVTFRVTDNGIPPLSDQETITITVNEVNKPPVAADATVNLDEDTTASIILKASDPDLPANILTYSVVSPPAHGKLSGTAPNLIYQPNPDFNGSDSFTFRVNDGSLNSNTATVNINVKPVNDSPVARDDEATTVEDTPVNINVTANDSDIDGDKIILVNVSNAAGGSVEIVGGEARFTPNPHFQGAGGFSYTISDGQGGTAVGKVTVMVNPAKPKS